MPGQKLGFRHREETKRQRAVAYLEIHGAPDPEGCEDPEFIPWTQEGKQA